MSNSGDVVPESEEEGAQADAAPQARAIREMIDKSAECKEQWKQIKEKWYDIDPEYQLPFPATESQFAGEIIWPPRVRDLEIIRRLQGIHKNEGDYIVPKEIVDVYNDLSKFAETVIKDITEKWTSNIRHLEKLERAYAAGRIPNFLRISPIELKFFEGESRSNLERKNKQTLMDASSKLLADMVEERHKIREDLLNKAANEIPELIAGKAVELWMDAQGNENGWDHIYPCSWANEPNYEWSPVPLSNVVLRAAMGQCKVKIGREAEEKRLAAARENLANMREQQRRQSIRGSISAMPESEATSSIMDKLKEILPELMQKALQPLTERVEKLEITQVQENSNAPAAAGTTGAIALPARSQYTASGPSERGGTTAQNLTSTSRRAETSPHLRNVLYTKPTDEARSSGGKRQRMMIQAADHEEEWEEPYEEDYEEDQQSDQHWRPARGRGRGGNKWRGRGRGWKQW